MSEGWWVGRTLMDLDGRWLSVTCEDGTTVHGIARLIRQFDRKNGLAVTMLMIPVGGSPLPVFVKTRMEETRPLAIFDRATGIINVHEETETIA